MEKTPPFRSDVGRLRATLWLGDVLVEDRVVDVHGQVALEAHGLSLPGAEVRVALRGAVLWVDDTPYPSGTATVQRGDARLCIEPAPRAVHHANGLPDVDWRLALVAAAGILLSATFDVVDQVLADDPELAARAAAVMVGGPGDSADCGRRYADCPPAGRPVVPDLTWRPPVRFQE
jgi:hypothetical protein